MEEKNAIITGAEIMIDDHGCLSAWVYLDYGGSGQGFGGHALYLPRDFSNHGDGKNYAGIFVWRVLEVVGVERWSDLKGKTVRVRATHEKVEAIGHIVKDNWFYPSVEFGK